MEGIQTLKGSWPWPWPSIRPCGISSCSNHRPLPIYQISFKLKKLFVDGRTYGWTYGRTGGQTFPPSILLGRLSEVDLKMKNMSLIINHTHTMEKNFTHRHARTNYRHSQICYTWKLPSHSGQYSAVFISSTYSSLVNKIPHGTQQSQYYTVHFPRQ